MEATQNKVAHKVTSSMLVRSKLRPTSQALAKSSPQPSKTPRGSPKHRRPRFKLRSRKRKTLSSMTRWVNRLFPRKENGQRFSTTTTAT